MREAGRLGELRFTFLLWRLYLNLGGEGIAQTPRVPRRTDKVRSRRICCVLNTLSSLGSEALWGGHGGQPGAVEAAQPPGGAPCGPLHRP